MEKTYKLLMPSPQNFIRYQVPHGFPSKGDTRENVIPITALNAEEAEMYAEELKQNFISHWKKMVSQ